VNTKKYVTALSIAGSDPSGGAGIQADLKTFFALGVYGMSAVTALTAQNTCGVRSIFEVTPQFLAEQLDAVFEDISVGAVKVGMLHRSEIVEVVADRLHLYQAKNIVLDPVMTAKGGKSLLAVAAIQMLKKILIPLATVITPNIPEAEILSGRTIQSKKNIEEVAEELIHLGCKGVLLKGGHFQDANESSDYLIYQSDGRVYKRWFNSVRINTRQTHGTGCTLSSALAANLAKGLNLDAAVAAAKGFTTKAIRHGAFYRLGSGHGPASCPL